MLARSPYGPGLFNRHLLIEDTHRKLVLAGSQTAEETASHQGDYLQSDASSLYQPISVSSDHDVIPHRCIDANGCDFFQPFRSSSVMRGKTGWCARTVARGALLEFCPLFGSSVQDGGCLSL